MKIIGLCGGSGSGKGTVAKTFLNFGITSVDTDAVYHDMTSHKSPCLDALVDEFGADIISTDGALDRKKLSAIVFFADDSQQKREKLNKISHKFVLDKTREMLTDFENDGYKAALVDAPLLFESGFDKECDLIISVVAKKEVRVERIIKRDGIDECAAIRRINSQITDEELISRSDFVIENSGSTAELENQVASIAKKILA